MTRFIELHWVTVDFEVKDAAEGDNFWLVLGPSELEPTAEQQLISGLARDGQEQPWQGAYRATVQGGERLCRRRTTGPGRVWISLSASPRSGRRLGGAESDCACPPGRLRLACQW